jgi:3-oxoacyl-[acyl-carrier protein] reductase
MDLGLRGKSVVVAASSEGIGRAAAELFAAEGARVAMCSRDAGKLEAAAGDIRSAHGGNVFAEVLDVTDEAAIGRFIAKAAERHSGVDVCVSNAGGPPAKMFLETTPEEWQRAFELNLMSTISFAHAVIPWMQKRRWGRIITVTSVSTRQPVPDLIYSNTIRAGVLGLVKSLSNQFGRDGITVNNVAPGYTLTARMRDLITKRASAAGISDEACLDQIVAQVPLNRAGRADEIADAIVWLASERASYITGQTLLVDGGAYKGL